VDIDAAAVVLVLGEQGERLLDPGPCAGRRDLQAAGLRRVVEGAQVEQTRPAEQAVRLRDAVLEAVLVELLLEPKGGVVPDSAGGWCGCV
jgi:hypothetical protein